MTESIEQQAKPGEAGKCTTQIALNLADLGFRIFPCLEKKPLIKNWQHDASNDSLQVEAWWSEYPAANIGILTDGLFVLDVDGEHNTWLEAPGRREELFKTAGAVVRTGGGGLHFFYRQPDGCRHRNTANKIAHKVDSRCDGGYVIALGSIVADSPYFALPGYDLDCRPEQFSIAPQWLLDAADERKPSIVEAAPIGAASGATEGGRNAYLTRKAGEVRRHNSDEGEILAFLLACNQKNRPPLPESEVRQIARSVARYEPDQVATLLVEGGNIVSAIQPLKIITAGELIRDNTVLRRPVIDRLLRLGEVMNVISAPKFGKSWLVLILALCVASGRAWLDRFETYPGKVLLIDNELHPETLASRLPTVARAMGLNPAEYESQLSVINLRGVLTDLVSLAPQLESMLPGTFDLIILDAWYRLQPSGSDENSNGDVAALYNRLDSVAHKINCAFACVHHSSKGSQSGKSITDVGSGAGAQARAPDTHLIMRPHEDENVVVVDAAVRRWAPIDPFCMRWEFPLWTVADGLDTKALRKDKPRSVTTVDKTAQEDARQAKEQAARDKLLQAYKDATNGDTASTLAAAAGMNTRVFGPIQAELLRSGLVIPCKVKKNRKEYDGFKLAAVV